MATDQLQRPQFFEGQYLGAADLAAVIDYARLRAARHSLGSHTWGIAVGLELKEEPSLAGGGAVDVYLQPGYAVDGFGRTLVVTSPRQIPPALFADENSGRVDVWLRYVEHPTAEPGFGFAVCETDDQHARVGEGFEVVVGDKDRLEQRDEISVAGLTIDAIESLSAFDENDPLLCDRSVPFQTFPDPGDALWLVPIGRVRWDSVGERLVETDAADRMASRAFRRHLGVVAEELYAVDGLIRLRARGVDTDGSAIFADCDADAQTFDLSGSLDLEYDEEKQRVRPLELVWIEGDLRLLGDGRLFGGKLEFRAADGDVDDVPLWIQRRETNDLGGKDLQILVGAGSAGENRLVVGQVTVDNAGNATVIDRMVVQDDGSVGIGTTGPTSALSLPLTIRGSGGDEDLIGFEDASGNLTWQLNQMPGGTEGLNVAETGVADGRLFLRAGGDVGIGTTDPQAGLHIAAGTDATLSAGTGFLLMGAIGSENLVLDSNEILARNNGATSTLHLQAEGGDLRIHTHKSESAEVLVTDSGSVGIGTIGPTEKLDVRGEIRVGAGGDYFAVGCVERQLRVIAGHVNAGGSVVAGDGFTSARLGQGRYRLSFAPAFSSAPVVVVSAFDPAGSDNVAAVTSLLTNEAVVETSDVERAGESEGLLNDTAFTFVAIGIRT